MIWAVKFLYYYIQMTKIDTYSLRITDTNQDLLIDYLKSIQASYVIGVIEIGSETEKEHYHSIFYTDLKINNIRNQLTRRGIVKSRQYSLKLTDTPIEGISYSIKQGLYSTNMDISHIPKWIPKEEFIKHKTTFTYTKMIAGYTPLVGENLKHKQILTHVYYYVIDNWYGKL